MKTIERLPRWLRLRPGPTIPAASLAVALATALLAGVPTDVAAQAGGGTPSSGAAPAGGSAPGGAPGAAERVNDYPTLARVEYVFDCLNENPGPRHEMVYKCVCAADRVAEAVPYDRWVDLSTFFNAQPIAGERGAYVRERSDIQAQLKSFRELQLNAKKACFIRTDPK